MNIDKLVHKKLTELALHQSQQKKVEDEGSNVALTGDTKQYRGSRITEQRTVIVDNHADTREVTHMTSLVLYLGYSKW